MEWRTGAGGTVMRMYGSVEVNEGESEGKIVKLWREGYKSV